MGKGGQPPRFEDGEQLISFWVDFCDEIIDNNYDRIPTQTAFCRWLAKNYKETDRKTIYNSLNRYFPNIKKEFERIQSDVIMQGGMLGRYNPTMSIFGLKNWCGWGDSGYVKSADTAEDDELTKALKEEAERIKNADK